jgi:hypothetical protein
MRPDAPVKKLRLSKETLRRLDARSEPSPKGYPVTESCRDDICPSYEGGVTCNR